MGNGSKFHYSLKNNVQWIQIPLFIKKEWGMDSNSITH